MTEAVHLVAFALQVACHDFQLLDGGAGFEDGQDRVIGHWANQMPHLSGGGYRHDLGVTFPVPRHFRRLPYCCPEPRWHNDAFLAANPLLTLIRVKVLGLGPGLKRNALNARASLSGTPTRVILPCPINRSCSGPWPERNCCAAPRSLPMRSG